MGVTSRGGFRVESLPANLRMGCEVPERGPGPSSRRLRGRLRDAWEGLIGV